MHPIKRTSPVALAFLIIVFCTNALASQIEKSPNDNREYRSLTLDNGLQLLLISDPETDRAAAALDISVGSGSDPVNRQGMAHFLEHMLFLGTEKYPEAGEYQAFIKQHGGTHNAYTAFQNTNYFFEIDAAFLEPALDRFAQQFISPLFNPEYVEREVNAVHSEFSAKQNDDYRRIYSAQREVINPAHPYSKFSVGNLTTLSHDEGGLHKDLLNFYHSNYSANLMKVVVYGKEPLDTLEKYTRERFLKIKNKHLNRQEFQQPLFEQQTLPALLRVEPVMESRTLELSFPIPSTRNYYKEKPTYYLSNLIGHEGEGSILSTLKRLGLAEGLSAGDQMDTGHASLFSVKISLTPNGMQQWKQIPAIFFQYIEKLRHSGYKKFYLEEQKQMLSLAFAYQQKTQPIHYASALASNMHDLPVNELLSSGYKLDLYTPELYQKFANYITPENMLITLVSKGGEYDRHSQWYNTPYRLETLRNETWPLANSGRLELFLPEKNEFIPEEAKILKGKTMKAPIQLTGEKGFNGWYAFDNEFSDPKASFFINIRSPEANNSPLNAVMTSLLTKVVRDELNEFTYPASLAGLDFSLYSHIRGISLKVSGYTNKQSVLLSKILNALKTAPIRHSRLAQFKDDLRRSFENSSKRKPYEQITKQARELLITPLWNDAEKLSVIDEVSIASMEAFRESLLKQLEIVTLAHGNITFASALNLNSLVKSFLMNTATPAHVLRGNVYNITKNKPLLYEMSFSHPDTGYLFMLQGENESFSERGMYALISQMISSAYYTDIRTEKQLGYIVFATPFSILNTPSIAFIVQSPNKSYHEIHEHTRSFLDTYQSFFHAMDPETFEQHKQSLINQIQEKDKKLDDRTGRYWHEIDDDNFAFDTKEKLATAISEITQSDLANNFSTILSNMRALLIVKEGDNIADSTEQAEPISSFSLIKSKSDLLKIQ